jgi:ABC-2 type transport system ATP-binding protein
MLVAEALTKTYPSGYTAVRALDLAVADGETVFLFGANGAGKSTTLHLFMDFIRPTSGRALVDGIEVAADPLPAKSHIAYIPENVAFYAALTGYENARFFAALGGRPNISGAELAEAVELVGLQRTDLDKRVGTLSKGMKQKLAIGIAWLRGARNLVMDEPTSGLDPASAASFMTLLREMRARGCAILVSSHDVFRVRDNADRIVMLREGRVVARLDGAAIADCDVEKLYLQLMTDSAVAT